MFRGISAVSLDPKGRLSIPTKYRLQLEQQANNQLIITIDTQDTCLLLYPLPEWELLESKIQNLPSFNKMARRVQRLLIGHATEVELDSNGRILIPAKLREYAVIEKQVVLVGQGKKFELWSEVLWEQGREDWLAAHPDEDKELPNELLSLSI